jgi:NitT/TauT family transport system permease protein
VTASALRIATMTSSAVPASRSQLGKKGPGSLLPILTIGAALLALWYVAAVVLNAPVLRSSYERESRSVALPELIVDAWSMKRPILPAPHQIAEELAKSVLQRPVTSPRSLVYHSWVTLSSAMVGFVLGSLLGIVLAIGIIHVPTLERSLLPWIIASQTVPILAIAPMIIVVLGSIGFVGLLPKAIISAYLCFFPVTIGMVKGLTSPETLQLDLMRTYSASPAQIFWKLRWPSALPFLFTSLKVAVALSVTGAIVGELPTGAQAGIGARLLSGSYYGQTVQIWAALVAASVLAAAAVSAVGLASALTARRMGGQT